MSIKEKDFIFGIILSRSFMTKGEESTLRALMIPFLAFHAKGGERKSPKQKDRTTTFLAIHAKGGESISPKQKDRTTT